MKKRILSLLCVLALCLGLLPTTALAADGIELYVGGQLITESGCYEKNQDGNWTKVGSAEPASGQFSYDAATATLTLNQAKIVNYQDVTVGGGFTYPGSVIAFSQSADVSLTIEVSQGTSNITGTGGIRVVSKAGDASLSISGPGSLEVKNVSNDSGIVLIGSKNVNLGINSADVTISNVQYYGVQLAAGDECKSTATINDGNLTVSDSVVGIYFMRLYTSGPSSLTVSGNAMVDTEGSTGGIINGSPDSFQIGADGESGGIVFNGKSGTVYGDVELQDDLIINEGETLTIPEGASLTSNDKLTNNGTIVNKGTMNGDPTGGSGTVVSTPTITTESLPEGMVDQPYTATLEATGNNITWSVTEGALPSGLTLNESTGEITGTPATEGQFPIKITATNSVGSIDRAYTLNIKPATVSVTGVTLDKTELSLYTGESKTLTAKVEPANATNQDVTWSSNNNAVATVESGTVKAVGEGEATITVTTDDGGKQATCLVKVTQATYNISIEGSLKFDAAYKGYAQPTAKTVTVTNTGNQTLTLEQPASTNSFEVGNLSKTQLAPDETATFTVQPKADLAVGSHEESINISGSNGNSKVSTSVEATFAVVDINDTKVKTDLTVTSGISASIPDTAFDTADKVKAELTRVLVQDTAYTAGNTAFYDVKLQYSLDGGNTWFEATEATFPTEGITVTLPYPSGTGKDTHNFRVVHMFTETSARLGTEAGKTETPAVTKTDSGLQVTLRGLSPVVIGWDKIETPSSGGSTTPAATATPAPSDNITYYTCPSCGYHNWTATDAGYRCDNCGYLESTRQLSGYGNVKGTYIPGSGATSTAVSTVPQTGDESNPVLWTVLLLVSGLALGGLAIAKRKKQQ